MSKRTFIWDVETNGLLPQMTRIHCLVMRDAETRETWRWRHHDGGAIETRPLSMPGVIEHLEPENDIEEGLRFLLGNTLVGHHIIGFDIRAVQKLHPWFTPSLDDVKDTLVLARVICPDIEKSDFRLAKAGKLPGGLIGSHSLDAWGYRVGLHKGDYSKQMLARGLDPWAAWNWDMEEYCVGDVDVNEIVWTSAQRDMPPPMCVELEMNTEAVGKAIEEDGIFFDKEGAAALAERLESEMDALSASVIAKFGTWYQPVAKVHVAPMFRDPEGLWKKKKYAEPNAEWHEDRTRPWWGKMAFPKKGMRSKKLGDRTEGCPYVAIKAVEFNPKSRDHIVKMLTERYGWVPNEDEWTETGLPSVSDATLQRLKDKIPIAAELAEILFLQKLIGMIKSGKKSWIGAHCEDGRVHHYLNVGGTVSGRCSHNNPNLGQVPAIECVDVFKEVEAEDGTTTQVPNKALLDADGNWIRDDVFGPDGKLKKEVPIFGREGEYGWECRNLFYTPVELIIDGEVTRWKQVGVDLTGIEFRMLAERAAKFDKGELIALAVSGKDVHNFNRAKIAPYIDVARAIIKRVFYGLMYGAGDWKLGYTADPHLEEAATIALGRQIRDALMKGVPALKKVLDECKSQAERGFLIGLDGRRLSCRSPHSALNLRLQSDAALIAKKWLCLTRDYLLAQGLNWGWRGDFVILAFVHDELQFACREHLTDTVQDACKRAAVDAGLYFGLQCPTTAEAKVGHSWADCH